MENAKQVFKATHGGQKPLNIASIELDCYVLENRKRVLSGRGVTRALGIEKTHAGELARFSGSSWLKPFIDADLATALKSPILFVRPGKGGAVAHGYEASILPKLCRAINCARRAGATTERQAALTAQE